jgi:hypothetical protein
MATITTKDIELGEGTLTLQGPSDGAAVDAGGTQGATLSYKQNFKKIEVGQVFTPVKAIMTAEEASFKVKLVESRVRNLIIAMGLDPVSMVTSATSDSIEFGGRVAPVYYLLNYTVPQIDTPAKNDTYILYRCQATSGLALNFEKNNERVFEITFDCLADSTRGYKIGRVLRDK